MADADPHKVPQSDCQTSELLLRSLFGLPVITTFKRRSPLIENISNKCFLTVQTFPADYFLDLGRFNSNWMKDFSQIFNTRLLYLVVLMVLITMS